MLGDSLVSVLAQPLWVLVILLARISPVILMTPPVNSSGVPTRVRGLLVLAIAVLLTPTIQPTATLIPPDLPHICIALVGEILLGTLLGSVVLLAITCLQLAGQAIGYLAGFDFAVSVDPGSSEEMPVLSNLLGLLAMAIWLLLGGHRQLLQCALDSFARYPAGAVIFEVSWLDELTLVLRHTFEVGLRAAAPIAVALLLSNIVTGLLARTLPQLNILSIGFNLNVSALLIALTIGLGSLTWVYQAELIVWLDSCHEIVGAGR
jgi:flagellar biosynthesis protein FliR